MICSYLDLWLVIKKFFIPLEPAIISLFIYNFTPFTLFIAPNFLTLASLLTVKQLITSLTSIYYVLQ